MACQDGPVPHPTVPVYFAALPRIKTGGSNQQRAPQQHITRRSSRCCRPLLARHRGRAAQPPVSRAAQARRPGSSTEDARTPRRWVASCSGSRFSASEFSKPIASGNRTEEDHAGKSMSVGGRTLFCRRSGGSDRRAWRSRQRPIRRAATTMPDWRLADGRGSGGHGGESDGQTQDPVGRHPYRPSHWFGSSVRCRSHRPGPARAGKAPRIDMIWAPRRAIRARWLSDDFANSRLAR